MEYTCLEILDAGMVACLLLCLLCTASWQMGPARSLGGGGGGGSPSKNVLGSSSNISGMKSSNIPYFRIQNYGYFISIFFGLELALRGSYGIDNTKLWRCIKLDG